MEVERVKKTYIAKKINLPKRNKTNAYLDEYWEAVRTAKTKYCHGIKEAREFCGIKLHYSNNAKAWWGLAKDVECMVKEV